jgi:hypothetical protein
MGATGLNHGGHGARWARRNGTDAKNGTDGEARDGRYGIEPRRARRARWVFTATTRRARRCGTLRKDARSEVRRNAVYYWSIPLRESGIVDSMRLAETRLLSLLADFTWSEFWPWLAIGTVLVIVLAAFFIWPDRILSSYGFTVKRGELKTDFTPIEWVTVGNQLWENFAAVKLRRDELLLKVPSRAEVYCLPLDRISEIPRPEWIEPLAPKQSRFRIKVAERDVPFDLGEAVNEKLSDLLRGREKV